ncbi:MAG: hypothetical protein HIU89_18225, partial [Proteobacteria bacterium]|nr:hypothetical protein [Pseudomonadota bacterium]
MNARLKPKGAHLAPLASPASAPVVSIGQGEPDSPAAGHIDPDRMLHSAQAKLTQGLSPTAMWLAYLDWSAHLANAPFRRAALSRAAMEQFARWTQALTGRQVIEAQPRDHRFDDPAWQQPPFRMLQQSFLLLEDWWTRAAEPAAGVNPHNARIISFAARQLLDHDDMLLPGALEKLI